MGRIGAVKAGRGVLAFGLAALPLALMPATCPGESSDAFGGSGLAVFLGLLAAGQLGGVLLRGWSGAAILIGGTAAGLLACAAVAPPDPRYPGQTLVCGASVNPGDLVLWGLVFVPIVLLDYGIARSLARSVDAGQRLLEVTPGRALLAAGTIAWLVAQFLPAWTYTQLERTVTAAGASFTFNPLGYLLAPGYWLAWPANLLLAAAWALVVRRARYRPAAWLAASATACAIGGVWIELDREVVEVGTFVWCASFAVLALGLAVRGPETRGSGQAHAGERPGVPAPPG
jgi:hypothetical protein